MFSVSNYAQGFGGIIGSYLAAVFTSHNSPKYIFVITAILSFIVAIQSIGIEEEQESDLQESEDIIYTSNRNSIN